MIKLKAIKQAGFSLTEVVVAVFIIGVMVAAMALLFGRLFQIPREQEEQGAVVAQAQAQMERMSDIIRNARDPAWVANPGPCTITVRSNADADADTETIVYSLDDMNDTLSRSVDDVSQTLATGVVNNCSVLEGRMFTYYSLGGGRAVLLNANPPVDEIDRVDIRIIIDVDTNLEPGAATIKTQVTPRRGVDL